MALPMGPLSPCSPTSPVVKTEHFNQWWKVTKCSTVLEYFHLMLLLYISDYNTILLYIYNMIMSLYNWRGTDQDIFVLLPIDQKSLLISFHTSGTWVSQFSWQTSVPWWSSRTWMPNRASNSWLSWRPCRAGAAHHSRGQGSSKVSRQLCDLICVIENTRGSIIQLSFYSALEWITDKDELRCLTIDHWATQLPDVLLTC